MYLMSYSPCDILIDNFMKSFLLAVAPHYFEADMMGVPLSGGTASTIPFPIFNITVL